MSFLASYNIKKLVAVLTPLFFICSCVEKVRNDVNRLDGAVQDLRSFQAEQTSKIAALESELRNLSGRVDVLDHTQSQRLGGDLNRIEEDLTSLRRRVPPPAIVPAEELERDEGRLSSLPVDLSKPVGDAFLKIREGNFERASSLLEEGSYLGAGTEWAGMIAFWQAIAAEGQGDNRKALSFYLDLVSRYPKDERAPLGLLRQGSVLIRLQDSKSARLAFTKLISDFPRSPEAQRARERLKELR